MHYIKEAYEKDPDLPNLLLDPYFKAIIENYQQAWRKVITVCIEYGIPIPAFTSAISYFDGYRSEFLPANLLQAQRDYFGTHTFERLDREGTFHHSWM